MGPDVVLECARLPSMLSPAVELITAGRLDAGPLITSIVPLQDAVHGPLETLLADRGQHLEILVAVEA